MCLRRARWLAGLLVVFFLNAYAYASDGQYSYIAAVSAPTLRIPGHVLAALAEATTLPSRPNSGAQPLTLTLVLRHDDQPGFERYLHELYDPHSRNFHRFLTPREIAERFGPSLKSYDSVLAFLRNRGFRLIRGSADHLTITAEGTRADAERAFALRIRDYQIGRHRFYANQTDPALPRGLAPHVQAIIGLSDLAQPHHTEERIFKASMAGSFASLNIAAYQLGAIGIGSATAPALFLVAFALSIVLILVAIGEGLSAAAAAQLRGAQSHGAQLTAVAPGSGQTIGLIEFAAFQTSDVNDYVNLIAPIQKAVGAPTSTISNLSVVPVSGGAPAGGDQQEALLDVDDVMTLAPGAKVVAYEAPFVKGSFQAVLNAMISGGVNVISNSWAYCEDQTTLADVQSIDTILQNAAAAGITVISGAGDAGSTCLDGSPNTVAVPADSPHLTAVGGSSFTPGPGLTYGSETWWDDSKTSPPAGQGGFGASKFFLAAGYQIPLSGGTMRSVPDVVVNADPFHGMMICQAAGGGCPNGSLYGGTSMAAPTWAALAAGLNQRTGKQLGFLNPLLYPLANTAAFHNAASLSSDFTHVGLGSPSVGVLALMLSGQSAGAVSPTTSTVGAYGAPLSFVPSASGIAADGKTQAFVKVQLADANGNPVSGKTVTIAPSGASSAVVSPSSAVTNVTNGAALFTVTDLAAEKVTFSATDTTDGIALTQQATVPFVTPAATSASLAASPATVTADGTSAATLTVTLQDSLGRPTPGKVIAVTQGPGHSVITGPTPMVTDSNGKLQLSATDTNAEAVTYAATDVTDGNLPIPNQPSVTFSNAPNPGCASGTPLSAPGLTVTGFASGFTAQSFNYGNVNWACTGAVTIAWDAAGNAYVPNFYEGNIYKFPPTGGVAGSGTLFSSPGKTVAEVVFDKSGNMYASLGAASSTTANSGAVVQIDPATGAVTRTIASGLTCPVFMALDPLSGDLFVDDNCTGGGADNPSVWRISNPSGASPTVSVYATLSGTQNGQLEFASDGTLYVVAGTTSSVNVVSGTNGPTPPTVTTVAGPIQPTGVFPLGANPSGGAQSLLLLQTPSGATLPETTTFDLSLSPPATASVLTLNGGLGVPFVGPDGCLYGADRNAVFRLTNNAGQCLYTTAAQPPTLVLNPPSLSPNPAQGSAQSFTASFHYINAPDGTPVVLNVNGANPQSIQVNTVSGVASFSYAAARQGVDTLTASATVGGANVTSNPATVTWEAGTDVTALTLNQSQISGTENQPASLKANLTDVSVVPIAPLAGQTISFNLGGATCSATTDSNGNASCQVTPTGSGLLSLAANFAGTGQYNASHASTNFSVTQPTPTPGPTPVPTASSPPTASPTPVQAVTRFSAPGASISASPGQQVSASFSAVNDTGASESVSSVTLAISNPGVFSSLALSANGQAASEVASPPQSADTFVFAPPIVLAVGASVSFSASATVAAHPTTAMMSMGYAMAGMVPTAGSMIGSTDWVPFFVALLILGLMLMASRVERRRLIGIAALVMALALSQVGCQGSSGSSPASTTVSSIISVSAANASGAGGATAGLPLTVATVTTAP